MPGPGSRLPVFFWLALMVAGIYALAGHTRVVSDLTLFLPRGSTPVEELLVDQLRSGPASRAILAAVEGAPAPALARVSEDLARRLRESGAFSLVNNGDVPLSPKERELLLDYRYLLSPGVTPDRFTETALRETLEQRLRDLASPMGMADQRLLPKDPTGELMRLLRTWSGPRAAETRHGVWFTPDGTRALLLVETRAPPLDPEAQAEAIQRIRGEFESAAGDGSVKLLLSGPSVFALEARNTIRFEARLLSGIAVGVVVVFLLAVYRSFRLLALFVIPVASGMVAGAAAVSLAFGSIHAITLAFGATIIGVALDYPIHLFSHRAVEEPPSRTVMRIWPTLRLSVVTTALGYTAMLFSGFSGLSQLGLFAIAGLLAAAAVTRWVLPPLTAARSAIEDGAAAPRLSAALVWLGGLRWLPLVLAAAGAVYLAFLDRSLWETDIANLSPVSSERKRIDRELREAMGAPDVSRLVVVFGDDPQQALERSEALAVMLGGLVSQGALAGFDAPSRYLPSAETQRRRRAILPAAAALRARLEGATRDLPYRYNLFEPFVADVAASRQKRPLTLADFDGTSLGLKIDSLIFPRGDRWTALLPLKEVRDEAAVARRVADMNGSGVHYLDLKDASNRLVTRYRNEALSLLAVGAAGIMLVLAVGLRSLAAPGRVLLPVAASIVAVVALLAALGERLSLFHIVALLLVAGVGLDYGLFFNRAHRHPAERERTVRAVLVCNVTTVLVFGVLAYSETPVLNAIGLTTASGAMLCMLFSAVLSRRPDEARP